MVVLMYIILLMQFWISGSFTVLTISGVTCTRQLKKQVEVESGCSYPWLSVASFPGLPLYPPYYNAEKFMRG